MIFLVLRLWERSISILSEPFVSSSWVGFISFHWEVMFYLPWTWVLWLEMPFFFSCSGYMWIQMLLLFHNGEDELFLPSIFPFERGLEKSGWFRLDTRVLDGWGCVRWGLPLLGQADEICELCCKSQSIMNYSNRALVLLFLMQSFSIIIY